MMLARDRIISVIVFLILIAASFGKEGSAFASIVPKHFVVKTNNGIEITVFPIAKVPIFDVELFFQNGANTEPLGRSGASSLMASLLNRGTPSRTETVSMKLLDQLAGSSHFGLDVDEFMVNAFGLDSEFEKILHYSIENLTSATFDERVFHRVRKNALESLSQIADSPASLASYAADLIATNGTTYARPIAGGWSDLQRITRQDLLEAHRPDRMKALLIAGRSETDPFLQSALKLLKVELEKLPCYECGKQLKPVVSAKWKPLDIPEGTLVLVDKKGFSESHVRLIARGPKRKVPEYHDLLVAENILGGTFGSRLTTLLREKLNLTYSVDVNFEFGRELGVFEIATSTRNERLLELLNVLEGELRGFVNDGVKKTEVESAKEYLLGSFPIGLQNSFLVAQRYFRLLLEGLSPKFLDEYPEHIRAVSQESVNAAIRKYFSYDRFISVVVCDAERTKESLKGRKSPVKVVSAKQVIETY